MDWTVVARAVAPLAPTLGALIGGAILPGLGGPIGGVLGKILASQFGVSAEPGAVLNSINSNSNEVVIEKLRATVEEAKARWQGVAAIKQAEAEVEQAWARVTGLSIEQVNETIRATRGHEHWFYSGWRAFNGWGFTLESECYGILLLIALTKSVFFGQNDALETMTNYWPLFLAYYGVRGAVVGIYVGGRSLEKREAIAAGTTATPSIEKEDRQTLPFPKLKQRPNKKMKTERYTREEDQSLY